MVQVVFASAQKFRLPNAPLRFRLYAVEIDEDGERQSKSCHTIQARQGQEELDPL